MVKSFHFLIIILFPLLHVGQGKNATQLLADGLKKYTSASGQVTYKITGDASGEETLLFDQYGWRSSKKRTMKFQLYKVPSTQKQQEIRDGEKVYRLNHLDSTVFIRTDTKWSNFPRSSNPKIISERILSGLGGRYHSDSTLLGRPCEVWLFDNKSLKELWVWDGLPLKTISMLGENKVITEATDVQLEVLARSAVFEIPSYFREIK